MKKLLLSFLILVTVFISNPLTAMARERPSVVERTKQSLLESLESPSQELPPNFLRLSDEIENEVDNLGPLKDLVGTWVGRGWNLIAVPINSCLLYTSDAADD